MIPGQRGRAGTPARILDVAERLVQTRGFASFSYASVAAELNISRAALHYHYPGKAELGLALISRYATRFREELASLDVSTGTAQAKLHGYMALYAGILGEQRACLCGMLAAEFETLPAPMRAEVARFFDDNERWLEAVLDQGRREGTIRVAGNTRSQSILFLSALEGAMLVARPCRDPGKFREATTALLGCLAEAPVSGAARP